MTALLAVSLAASAQAQESDSSPPDARRPPICIDAPIAWGQLGALVSEQATDRLLPCRTFEHSDTSSCRSQLSSDAAQRFSVQQVIEILSHPDLVQALDAGPRLLGRDMRLVGGTVLRIESSGGTLLVGAPCRRAGPGCERIPPGLQAAVRFLLELSVRQLQQPGCAEPADE